MQYQPIPEQSKYETLIKQIKDFVQNLKNWNYKRPNEDYSIFRFGRDHQIVYIGASHVVDTNDPLISILKKEFNDFTREYSNSVVLIEDWEVRDFDNEAKAIDKKGERGLLMLWAKQKGFFAIPIDYERKKIYRYLIDTYGIEKVTLFCFLYLIKNQQLNQRLSEEQYKKEVELCISKSFAYAGIDHSKLDYIYIDSLYTKEFGKAIYEDRDKNSFNYIDPLKTTNTYSQIFKDYHTTRDENFLYQILVNYYEGKNVFVVLGQDHALLGEPFISKLIALYRFSPIRDETLRQP